MTTKEGAIQVFKDLLGSLERQRGPQVEIEDLAAALQVALDALEGRPSKPIRFLPFHQVRDAFVERASTHTSSGKPVHYWRARNMKDAAARYAALIAQYPDAKEPGRLWTP